MATVRGQDAWAENQMKVGISLETTRVLRDTWHSAINHDWYDFLKGHTIVPLVSADTSGINVSEFDLIVLCGGNDMSDFVTWRNNNDPQRDRFEARLIDQAIERMVPVVGICRGSHFINKHMGGTLRMLDTPYDNVQVALPGINVVCHHTIAIDAVARFDATGRSVGIGPSLGDCPASTAAQAVSGSAGKPPRDGVHGS